jgi:hypothetical protein
VAEAEAAAVAAIAKVASNTSKVTIVARTAPEHLGDSVHASPMESLAIGLRTAKRTQWRVR